MHVRYLKYLEIKFSSLEGIKLTLTCSLFKNNKSKRGVPIKSPSAGLRRGAGPCLMHSRSGQDQGEELCSESGATKEEDLTCRPFSAVCNDEFAVSRTLTFCVPLLLLFLLRFKGALQTNVQGGATYCLSDILCTDVSINIFP